MANLEAFRKSVYTWLFCLPIREVQFLIALLPVLAQPWSCEVPVRANLARDFSQVLPEIFRRGPNTCVVHLRSHPRCHRGAALQPGVTEGSITQVYLMNSGGVSPGPKVEAVESEVPHVIRSGTYKNELRHPLTNTG